MIGIRWPYLVLTVLLSYSLSLLGFSRLPNPIESRGGGVFVSRESEKDFESASGKSPFINKSLIFFDPFRGSDYTRIC